MVQTKMTQILSSITHIIDCFWGSTHDIIWANTHNATQITIYHPSLYYTLLSKHLTDLPYFDCSPWFLIKKHMIPSIVYNKFELEEVSSIRTSMIDNIKLI